MLQTIAVAELILCWIVWASSFFKPRQQAAGKQKVVRARSSLVGIGLEVVGFSLVWMYVQPVGFQKSAPSLIASMLLAPLSTALVWAATRHLGKQWRFEAALNDDHELIRTGPYSFVRHPIYASMFGMLLATGFAKTWWPMFVAGVIFFLIGTEIRVRAEDRLLSERFGPTFAAYRSQVRGYIPFIR